MAEIRPPEALGDPQGIAVGMGLFGVDPAAVPESVGVDHKGIVVPAAHRIPQPGRVVRNGQGPSVGEHLAENHPHQGLIQKRRDRGGLQDLERTAGEIDPRHAGRQAIAVRIIDVIARGTLRRYRRCPGRHLHVARFQVPGQIEIQASDVAGIAVVNGAFGRPDAREIRRAVRKPGSRRRQIRLAVGQARNSGSLVVQPLRCSGRSEQTKDDEDAHGIDFMPK